MSENLFRSRGGNRYHVLGLVIADPEIIQRTRNVIKATAANVCLLLVRAAFEFSIGQSVVQTMVGLVSALFVPMVGYIGAKNGSPLLVCVFCGLMLVHSSHALALLILLLLLVLSGKCMYFEEESGRPIPEDAVPQTGEIQCRTVEWSPALFFFLVISALWALLAFWAAYNGSRLLRKLSDEGSITVDESMDMDTSAVEPESKGNPSLQGRQVGKTHVILDEEEDIEMAEVKDTTKTQGRDERRV